MNELSALDKGARAIEATQDMSLLTLTADQREMLSKALFPDTHTDTVEVLGVKRTLRPLPIKWSKQMHALLAPFHEGLEAAEITAEGTNIEKVKEVVANELDLLSLMLSASEIIATYYKWEDVLEALKSEEVLSDELQALIVVQQNLQKANDFLLMGLRMLVGVMQQAEIQSVRMLSMFSGLS